MLGIPRDAQQLRSAVSFKSRWSWEMTNNPILECICHLNLANSQIPERRIAETNAARLLQTLWQDTKAMISLCWFSPCHYWIRLVWGIARRMLSSFPKIMAAMILRMVGNNTRGSKLIPRPRNRFKFQLFYLKHFYSNPLFFLIATS